MKNIRDCRDTFVMGADAEIAYLQGRVHELETQMVNSP